MCKEFLNPEILSIKKFVTYVPRNCNLFTVYNSNYIVTKFNLKTYNIQK